jgi:hypothetical protein
MRRRLALAAALAVLGPATYAGGASSAAADSTIKTAYGPTPTYSMAESGDSDFWTCSGFRLAAGATVQDHFTCTISDQTFTGTFTENTPWPCGCTGWWSDYDGQLATRYVIRVSSNGQVMGTATY